MVARANNFDLRLLTSSREIGLRKLRSYAAALGGQASIFHAHGELLKLLAASEAGATRQVVLTDNSIPMNDAEKREMGKLARLFFLDRTPESKPENLPLSFADLKAEAYFRCTLQAMFDAPLLRISVAQLLRPDRAFHLEQLLRWGHAASVWTEQSRLGIADHSLAFARALSLTGEARRLLEISSHFVQTRLPALGLQSQKITFASDGLLVAVISRCRSKPGIDFATLSNEVFIHELPISVINCLAPNEFEIAALYTPYNPKELSHERVFLIFEKGLTARQVVPLPLDKAG